MAQDFARKRLNAMDYFEISRQVHDSSGPGGGGVPPEFTEFPKWNFVFADVCLEIWGVRSDYPYS
jgi:hypothetical protein